jgi:uncharacterized protein YndB with AHSA1/START domain
MSDRKHEFSVEIKAPKEAVWEALTVPSEIVKWLAPIAEVQPGVGGKIDIGWTEDMKGSSEILEWQPNEKLTKTAHGGQRIEFIISGEGGTTTLRLVHSGFSAESSFDDEFESTRGGWLTFFAILRYGLERHPGVPGENVTVLGSVSAPRDTAWPRVPKPSEALGRETREIAQPAPGYLVASIPDLNDSLLAVFCEACGPATYVTYSAYLFGDARSHAVEIRECLNQSLATASSVSAAD